MTSIRYSWTFGDTGTSTSANPSRTYAAPGTYTVILTATDVWGKFATATHDVTMTEPAGNTGPDRDVRQRHLHRAVVCDDQHRDGRPGGSHHQGLLVELG